MRHLLAALLSAFALQVSHAQTPGHSTAVPGPNTLLFYDFGDAYDVNFSPTFMDPSRISNAAGYMAGSLASATDFGGGSGGTTSYTTTYTSAYGDSRFNFTDTVSGATALSSYLNERSIRTSLTIDPQAVGFGFLVAEGQEGTLSGLSVNADDGNGGATLYATMFWDENGTIRFRTAPSQTLSNIASVMTFDFSSPSATGFALPTGADLGGKSFAVEFFSGRTVGGGMFGGPLSWYQNLYVDDAQVLGTLHLTGVPEPSSLMLLLSATLGCLMRRRRV